MSVERVERKDGSVVWRVRWRQGEHNRSKVVGRTRDADAFEAELRRRKRTGEMAQLDAGKEPLSEFGEEWWRLYAEPNLAPWTLRTYAAHWDAHVLPRLGSIPLRELTSDVINRFRLELEAAGVGPASVRKALTLLQGVLQRACEWGRIWVAIATQATDRRFVEEPLRDVLFRLAFDATEAELWEPRADWPLGGLAWFEVARLGLRDPD